MCTPGDKILEAEDEASSEAGPGQSTLRDEAAVETACERMVLEVVRLLQDGKVEQAEYFLLEGAVPRCSDR